MIHALRNLWCRLNGHPHPIKIFKLGRLKPNVFNPAIENIDVPVCGGCGEKR